MSAAKPLSRHSRNFSSDLTKGSVEIKRTSLKPIASAFALIRFLIACEIFVFSEDF
jgi:hypothetical protein